MSKSNKPWPGAVDSRVTASDLFGGCEPEIYTYASKQRTVCAVCGCLKHTPLRRDEMGGYVCLTCIDRRLDEVMDLQPNAKVNHAADE